MNIVVVGCDRIGKAVVKQLVKDGHGVTVIDSDKKKVEWAVDKYEITGIVGNGAVMDIQKKADVDNADVLIACTNSDEVNILCCTVAKKLGVKHTIIRNSNDSYYHQIIAMRDELGLSLSIDPEYEAAAETARILRFPSALQLEIFADGKMELVEHIITNESMTVDTAISTGHGKMFPDVQICAVQRGDDVFIPNGDFVLNGGDRISIASTPKGIVRYFKEMGLYQNRARYILILGGGDRSCHLAKIIGNLGMNVKIIESDLEKCRYLSDILPKAEIIYGNGSDYDLLMEEGLVGMDAVVSFTSSNERNIITSLFALNRNVNKVITAIDRDSLFPIVSELELGSIISPNILCATKISHFIRGSEDAEQTGSKIQALYKIVNNQAEVLEFVVTENFKGINKPLKELKIIDSTIIAVIIRDDDTIIPRGNDLILPNDKVVVVTTQKGIDGINDILR